MLNLPIKILQTQQIEAAQATVTFTGIDTQVAAWDAAKHVTSRHLILIVNAQATTAVNARSLVVTFNGDGGANYNDQELLGLAAVPSAFRDDGATSLDIRNTIPGTFYSSYAFGGGMLLIPHAFNAANHKAALFLGGAVEASINAWAGRWASNAAITSISLSPGGNEFAAGSTFHLGVIDERYLVEEILLTADGTPMFDNIPQGEGNLAVVAYARSDQAAVEDEVLHSINDDTTAGNYPAQEALGRGAGPPTAAFPVNQECAMVSGDNATALAFGAFVEIWSQYTKDNQPQFLTQGGYHETSGPTGETRLMVGRRTNIEPINKLHYKPNAGTDFKSGSLFSLYRVPKRIIERIIVPAGGQATIDFNNIPQNFEALLLHVYARTDVAAVTDAVAFSFNNDVNPVFYDFQQLLGQAGAVNSGSVAAGLDWLYITGNTEGEGEYSGGSILIPAYTQTERHKHAIKLNGRTRNLLVVASLRWESLNAITRITLTPSTGPNFLAGSIFELEGVLRREGLPPSEGMRMS